MEQIFRKTKVLKFIIGRLDQLGYRPTQPPLNAAGDANPAYAGVIDEFVDRFGGYSDAVLKAGMDEFVANWGGNAWPKIGQLRPYIADAKRTIDPEPAYRLPETPEPRQRSESEWSNYRAKTAAICAEADRYDREELGIEPPGKPASQMTKRERHAYESRREEAMRQKGIGCFLTAARK